MSACSLVVAGGLAAACESGDEPLELSPTRSTERPAPSAPASGATTATTASPAQPAPVEARRIAIDVDAAAGEISPLIVGMSPVALTPQDAVAAGVRLTSWGGNPSSRYNYEIGNAWNHGADYEFRNTSYGVEVDAMRDFLGFAVEAGTETRVAVPTLGWVAADNDESTCSFPDRDGGCRPPSDVGTCQDPRQVADPALANVASTPAQVADWIEGLIADGYDLRFIAMDNEPELWGHTHFDVHPECPTYQEILDTYLEYATAVRAVAPDAELTGPAMCCWYDYWRIAPGPTDDGPQDFLQWFLQRVKEHDEATGVRTLDVVDVHFYPQTGVYNDDTDPETSARRLRSTRALWDPTYVDESWIDTPIEFIPRMLQTIELSYPGTPLMISEWNFGAEETLNGALAIAETLGIYGREGVYAATYWRDPELGSPGYLAFAMHGDYDGAGSRFGGRVVPVPTAEGSAVVTFAAIDDDDEKLRVMLINEQPDAPATVQLDVSGFEPGGARSFTLGPEDESTIVAADVELSAPVTLPPTSITLLELTPAG